MRADFRMLTHLNESCLHLKLMGNMDDASAGRVTKLLKRYVRMVSTVIIHTSGLTRVPCATDELRNALSPLRQEFARVIVTGEHASLFA